MKTSLDYTDFLPNSLLLNLKHVGWSGSVEIAGYSIAYESCLDNAMITLMSSKLTDTVLYYGHMRLHTVYVNKVSIKHCKLILIAPQTLFVTYVRLLLSYVTNLIHRKVPKP